MSTGAPEGIRTSDLCLRRATLYPQHARPQGGLRKQLDIAGTLLPICILLLDLLTTKGGKVLQFQRN
jgi:hypothetical protein